MDVFGVSAVGEVGLRPHAYMKYFFVQHIINLWNSLPQDSETNNISFDADIRTQIIPTVTLDKIKKIEAIDPSSPGHITLASNSQGRMSFRVLYILVHYLFVVLGFYTVLIVITEHLIRAYYGGFVPPSKTSNSAHN